MRRATLLTVMSLAATGCLGTTESTTFSEVGDQLEPLPAACESAITEFLIEVEPVVADVDFETASEDEITAVGEATVPAAENFDPDACPDFSPAEAREAWLQIAQREAPGTVGYVEYTYPDE
jgi:hypothetical protein